MANSVGPDQTAPIGALCSGSTLFASILNLSVMLGNYLQQTTSADNIFRCIFFLALKGLKGKWTGPIKIPIGLNGFNFLIYFSILVCMRPYL